MESDLARKLGLKEGQRVYILNSSEAFRERIDRSAPQIDLGTDLGIQAADMVIAWPDGDLTGMFQRFLNVLKPDGAIWVVIPKKARGLPGPTFEALLTAALPQGLVDNKSLTLSHDEYAIRFMIRRRHRQATTPTNQTH